MQDIVLHWEALVLSCTNGSRKKAGAPSVGWIPINVGFDDLVSRAVRALGLAPSIPISDVSGFCSVPPPEPVEIEVSDWFDPTILSLKLAANARAIQWGEWCECQGTPSTPPPGGAGSYTISGNTCVGFRSYTVNNIGGYSISEQYASQWNGAPYDHRYVQIYGCSGEETEKVYGAPGDCGWSGTPTVTKIGDYTCPDVGQPPTPPQPPAYPPDLPPPPPYPPMSPEDKQELLNAINSCHCQLELSAIATALGIGGVAGATAFTAIEASLAAILAAIGVEAGENTLDDILDALRPNGALESLIKQIRDETIPDAKADLEKKIKETIPKYLQVKFSCTGAPSNAKTSTGSPGQILEYLGWFQFRTDDYDYPRQFINWSESVFLAPVPGEDVDYTYHLADGVTGTWATEYIEIKGEEED